MSKPDSQVNELHLRDPQPGDFWHERFCPYHIVLTVTPSGIVIADKTRPDGDSHYTFDLESAREITHEEHAKAVRYSSGNGFVADVVPARATGAVREWKAAGCKYMPATKQRAASEVGEALMDTNKMREQFEDWASAQFVMPVEVIKECRYEGTYANTVLNIAWRGWEASREAVVVELPDHFRPSREEVIAAIQAQGLKVAP